MLGGRRVVRVRDAVDALASPVEQAASGPGDSLLVLEASGALPARSKLRALVEGLPTGAAIACYPEEGRALQEAIRSGLAEAGITLDPDAQAWLLEHVGSDWAATARRNREADPLRRVGAPARAGRRPRLRRRRGLGRLRRRRVRGHLRRPGGR